MANYNFLNLLKPVNKPGKSGFDLSQKHVFSTKPGQCVPCMALETVPGDHHEINLSSLNRTMAMNTPAFLRGKFRYDFMFVPYVQLWHNFDMFITQRDDRHSSLSQGSTYVPVLHLKDLLNFIGIIYRYQKVNNSAIYNQFDKEDWPHGAVRLLDMLGYGLYDEIFDIIDDDIANSTTNFTSFCNLYNGKYVNVFRLAAYQHIWYDYYRNKFYDLEFSFVYLGNTYTYDYINMFNFDDLSCNNFANSVITIDDPTSGGSDFYYDDVLRIVNLLTLRHIQWKKDIFTSALPGTQFGSVSSVQIDGVTDTDSGRWNHSSSITVFGGSPSNLSYLGSDKNFNINGDKRLLHDHEINVSFDVLALKRAEALQQWKQNTLRAGNMTDDAYRAHFGVEPYYYQDNNVRYLGSYEAMLQINAVNTTATTGQTINGKVADQGATGTAVSQGQTIKFDTNDFGVVICVSSFLPEAEYSANMLDKANRLHEQFDFFTPEYQNIGLETLTAADYNINAYIRQANFVMGYVNRYSMYKTAVDKVHGQFANNLFDTGLTGAHFNRVKGSLIPWVTPRSESMSLPLGGAVPKRDKNSWYVDSNILDNVLGIASDPSEDTDSLLHNVYFDIKSIRPMTVLGLPQF